MSCAQYCAAGDPCSAAGEEINCPCAQGKTYHGRGPMQLSWNYNYKPAGDALGVDLLSYPEEVTKDPVLAFQTGIYFWMTERGNKPSAHDVILGCWEPTAADREGNRLPGFGVTTNIINGALECSRLGDYREEDRVAYFLRFARHFGISPGPNLRCDTQASF